MRTVIIMLLVLAAAPLASPSTFEGVATLQGTGNETLTLHLNGSLELPVVPAEEDPCPELSITGLPLTSADGEKLSFGFSEWQEGDEVTYWVEDARGLALKDPYTTTSSSKKSYTPSLEASERAIIFRAERSREGCDVSSAQEVVIVLGEEQECPAPEPAPEPAPCAYEEDVLSLYVRAQNWQENITIYGNVALAGEYLLFGTDGVRSIPLEEGTFQTTISPVPGQNTYGLVPAEGGIPRTVTFSLEGEEAPVPVEQETINDTLNATLVIEPPLATGEVILDDGTARNTSLIAGLSGVAGAGLVLTWAKTKLLRSRSDSA